MLISCLNPAPPLSGLMTAAYEKTTGTSNSQGLFPESGPREGKDLKEAY